jgi:hypothetical protein
MVRNSHTLTLAAAGIAALALTLSACGSDGGGSTSPDGTAGESAVETVEANGVPASLIGLHIEGVEAEAWAAPPFGALRLWDNGTAWSQIELEKGVFKWDNLDGAIANANSKGMTDILMVLGTTPEWAASEKTDPDTVYPPYVGANTVPANLEDWDTWVRTVATKYAGQITSYQIWNEASYTSFYNGTPEEMAELTERAYKIIKEVDPNAKVVSASPALRLKNAFDRFFPAYLAALAERNWPVDVIAVHTYPSADGDPAARGELIAAVRAAITAGGAPDTMELWDTELNYGLAGPGPDRPRQEITGARAAGFIVRTYIDNLRYGVDRSYWYIYTQQPYDLLGIQAFPGSDGEQGFYALDNWVIGAAFDQCTEAAGAVTCVFSKSGTSWTIAWAQSGEVAFTAPAGSQLVCDPLSNCQELREGQEITLTEIPVRIYQQ